MKLQRFPNAFYDIFTDSNINVAKQVAYEFQAWCDRNNIGIMSHLWDDGNKFGGVYVNQAGGGM